MLTASQLDGSISLRILDDGPPYAAKEVCKADMVPAINPEGGTPMEIKRLQSAVRKSGPAGN